MHNICSFRAFLVAQNWCTDTFVYHIFATKQNNKYNSCMCLHWECCQPWWCRSDASNGIPLLSASTFEDIEHSHMCILADVAHMLCGDNSGRHLNYRLLQNVLVYIMWKMLDNHVFFSFACKKEKEVLGSVSANKFIISKTKMPLGCSMHTFMVMINNVHSASPMCQNILSHQWWRNSFHS